MLFNVLKWVVSWVYNFDPQPSPGPTPEPSPLPEPSPAPNFDLLGMIRQTITFVDDTIEFLEKLVTITPTSVDNEYLAKLKSVVDVLKKALDSPLLQQLLSLLTNHPGVLSLRGDARNAAIVSLAEQNSVSYQPGVQAMGIPWGLLLQVLPLVVRFLLSFAGKRQVQFQI